LLRELEPYAYHTRLKIDQQKQSSYTFIKKTERSVSINCIDGETKNPKLKKSIEKSANQKRDISNIFV
jgi:hypothetical protein